MSAVEFLEIAGETHEDPRGFIFFPWQQGVQEPQEALRTLHLISIAPGQTRGNHLHPGHREFLYAFHGAGVLLWEEPPGQVQERLLTGRRTLVRIPPGIAHALRNPGPGVLYLLAWRERVAGSPAEPESVSHPLTA